MKISSKSTKKKTIKVTFEFESEKDLSTFIYICGQMYHLRDYVNRISHIDFIAAMKVLGLELKDKFK